MDNHESSSVAIEMSLIASEQSEGNNGTVAVTETRSAHDRLKESRYQILTKWRTAIFTLGVLNSVIGVCIFPLYIAFTILYKQTYSPYGDGSPNLLVATRVAADLGKFDSLGLNSSMMLLLCGLSGIVTRWKSSTIKVFPSLLLSGAAAVSCIGGFGNNVFNVMLHAVPYTGLMSPIWSPVGHDGFNMLIALATLCLVGAAASVTQCVFSYRSLYLCLSPLEREITEDNIQMTQPGHLTMIATSRSDTKYLLSKRKQTALFKIGIAEIIFGLVIVGVEAVAFVITGKAIGNMYRWPAGDDNIEIHIRWPLSIHSTGLWGGIIVSVSGALGIALSVRSSVGMVNANMVMSLIAASVSCLVNFVAAYAIEWQFERLKYHISVAALSAAAVLLCVAHAALCCNSQCSARSFHEPTRPLSHGVASTDYVQEGVAGDGLPILAPARTKEEIGNSL